MMFPPPLQRVLFDSDVCDPGVCSSLFDHFLFVGFFVFDFLRSNLRHVFKEGIVDLGPFTGWVQIGTRAHTLVVAFRILNWSLGDNVVAKFLQSLVAISHKLWTIIFRDKRSKRDEARVKERFNLVEQ